MHFGLVEGFETELSYFDLTKLECRKPARMLRAS